jgi:hypothetical protein
MTHKGMWRTYSYTDPHTRVDISGEITNVFNSQACIHYISDIFDTDFDKLSSAWKIGHI